MITLGDHNNFNLLISTVYNSSLTQVSPCLCVLCQWPKAKKWILMKPWVPQFQGNQVSDYLWTKVNNWNKWINHIFSKARTIPYLPFPLTPVSSVTVRSRATTLIQRQTVSLSTFVPTLEMVDWPSTVFSVPMVLCSISNISFVTGGSMWTVHCPRVSTVLMKTLLLNRQPTIQKV